MKYKVTDTPLRLKEYGRNIQSMVEYAKTIEDHAKRSRIVKEIVRIMVCLNPNIKDMPDFEQKLWDHLYLIADFDLDVDAPFPMPAPEEIVTRNSHKMPYPKNPPLFKQYGKNVELMIEKALDMPEGSPQRKEYLNQIANTMKQFLRFQDRETTPEEVIAQHMMELSKGRLKISARDITIHRIPIKGSGLPFENGQQLGNRSKKNNRGRKPAPRKNRRRK